MYSSLLLRHFSEDPAHLVGREGAEALRTNVAQCTDTQEQCGRGVVIRRFNDGRDVVLTKGPVDLLDGGPEALRHVLQGIGTLRGFFDVSNALIGELSDD